MDVEFDPKHRETIEALAKSRLNRRSLLRRAACAAATPLAMRALAGTAAFSAFTPKAVGAAQKALRQTGDSADMAVAAAQQFKGTTLTIISESGLQAQDPINFSGPLWEELTGIKLQVVEKPFDDLFTSMVQEHIGQTGAFDILQPPPAWLADFVTQGVVEPLDPFINEYMNKADLDDFHPLYRNLMNYGGNIYGLFDDGDTFILYYRTDLFDDPANKDAFKQQFGYDLAAPKTWKEYDDIQGFFTELGAGAYWGGASQRKPSQVHEWFLPEFRINGGRFFDETTLDATLDSEAGLATLTRMLTSNKTMPPGVETWDFTAVLTAWMAGQLAMIGGTWPPIGRFSEDYGKGTKQLGWVPPSTIAGKVLYANLPGGHTEMAGGFLLSVAADSKNKEAAYLFSQWANSPSISLQRCMLPYSLRDPFRLSHYSSPEYRSKWPNAGAYLDTLKAAADGALLDIIMPGSAEYHTTIDQMFGSAQGGTDLKQALAEATTKFNEITDRIGRDTQKAAYAEYLKLAGAYPT